ncbi:MAG: hypothetical protein JST16_06515 [Bdellovibrionales bacterium]|nr:hypothetical protein [Bdellovibrionales bacterium]
MNAPTPAPTSFALTGALEPAFRLPVWKFDHSKWSAVRHSSAKDFGACWASNKDLVMVLEDSSLREDPLVVLKKTHLDTLIKLVSDLISGEALVRHELNSMADAVSLVVGLASKDVSADPSLKQAIQVLRNIQVTAQAHSVIVTSNPPKKLKPRPIDESLKAQISKNDD